MVNKEGNNYYFEYRATLRIFGEGLDHEAITATLGLDPTHTHKQGDMVSRRSTYENDMWSYTAPLERIQPLEEHIQDLWERVKDHKAYLLELKKNYTVDVFCGYRSDSSTAGFDVSYTCLEMFTELQIPFGVSIIVDGNELEEALVKARKRQKRIKYKR